MKPTSRQRLSKLAASTTAWAILALIVVVAGGALDPFGIHRRLDWIVKDQFLRNRTPVELHPDLLQVEFDEFAAVRLSQDPQRRQLARALHQLKLLGVKTVLVDMLLFGRGNNDPVNIDDLVDQEGLPVAIAQHIEELPNRFLEDQMLAASLEQFKDPIAPRIVIPFFHRTIDDKLDRRSSATLDAMTKLLKADATLDVKQLADQLQIDSLTETSRLYEEACHRVADDIAREPKLEQLATTLLESMRNRETAWTPELLAQEHNMSLPVARRLFNHAYALALDNSLRDPRHIKQGIGFIPTGIALRVPMAFDRHAVLSRLAENHSFTMSDQLKLATAEEFDVPLSDFAKHSVLGFANFDADVDGTFRRIPLIKEWSADGATRGVSHQSLAAVAVHHGVKISDMKVVDGTVKVGSKFTVPVDAAGRLAINWPAVDPKRENGAPFRFSLGELLELAKYDADLKQNRQNLRLNVTYLDNLLDLGFADDEKCDVLLNAIYDDYINGKFDAAYEKERQFDRDKIPQALAHEKAKAILASVGVEPLSAADAEDQSKVSALLINQIQAAIGRIEADRDAQIQALQQEFQFEGKLCLVGDTRIASEDLKQTPVLSDLPGVTINLAAINTILQQRYLSTPGFGSAVALTILLGVALSWVFQRISAVWSFGVMAVGMLAVFVGHYLALTTADILASPVLPMIGVLACFLVITTRRWWTDVREKQKVREAFQYYLHPAMVDKLTRDPELVRLGGEDKDLTILFADIRGFSGISEKLTAEELQKYLNGFFTPMSRIAQDHDGTIDKYIGDEMMVFYGAPLDVPNHPLQAVLTALKMIERLKTLQVEWRKQGLPDIRIGVGINTNIVRVGNFGSDDKFDYTVIGDGVNLASRLQGATKQYGVQILVSENTWKRLDNKIVGREIDRIQVLGRLEPTRIFNPVGLAPLDDQTQKFLDRFQAGMTAFQERKWHDACAHFHEAKELDGEDRPTTYYIERCEQFMAAPPPADWSGVTSLDTK